MKNVLKSSFLAAEIAAFIMLMVLFFISTNRPYLLLVPITLGFGGYYAFKAILGKLLNKESKKTWAIIAALPVLLGFCIAGAVIGLFYLM
ncbi:MAG: hypothetical protein FWH20_09610 [Oscillospiraceae bacterium]|nr:hypothetical protein [Oscillospiraceae bacterium]